MKGVIIAGEPPSIESDNIGPRPLRRRRTKAMIPITENKATTTPAMLPAIAGVFDFECDDVFDFVVVTLTFMSSTGAL